MKEIKTKEDVFKAICNASRLGNLGFFVGSGFTKAILENNTYYEAYTWAELLKVCCEEMKINENILKNMEIRLPVDSNDNIDYTYITTFIQAQEKLSIKNVIDWKDKIINTSKKCI